MLRDTVEHEIALREIEKDAANKTTQEITTDGYTLNLERLKQGECNVWELHLQLKKERERREKRYTLSSKQAKSIDKYISDLLQCNIGKLVLYFNDISYDNANNVRVIYSDPRPIYKEVKAGLTKYILENHSDLIEEMIK